MSCSPGASIPMRGGTSMVMSPNILEVMSFRMSTQVTATVVCLTQIFCVVSQQSFSFWGILSPRPPSGAPPLDPTLLLCLPQIILWNRCPCCSHILSCCKCHLLINLACRNIAYFCLMSIMHRLQELQYMLIGFRISDGSKRLTFIFSDHFSGPDGVIGLVCVCCVDNNF